MPVKKEIRFEDLDGNPVVEEYWFSLAKTDVFEMDIMHMGDPVVYLKKILDERDTRALLSLWKELLFRAVAKRKGNILDKSDAVLEEFRGSGAYDQLFSELLEAEDGGASFFVSIMPADVQEKAKAQENRVYTKDELLTMSDEEFERVAGTDLKTMTPEHFQIAFQRKNNADAA